MKKIRTQEQENAKKTRNKYIGGGILIFLMVFSTAGFALYGGGGSETEYEEQARENPYYNGQYWDYDLGGTHFYFTQKIEDLEPFPVNVESDLQAIAGKNVYIDSDNEEANSLLSTNLARYTGRIQRGCYGACEEDLPERDCEGEDIVIIIETSEEQSVNQDRSCFFIEGDLTAVDAFTYRILGVSYS